MRIARLLSSVLFLALVAAEAETGIEPTALAPLIKRANAYLSVGQFSDAVRSYTEAIGKLVLVSIVLYDIDPCATSVAEQSPSDYLLYYKRATAYFSINRHANALEDFDTVLRLTHGSFDKALLMKAKILAREANWAEAKRLTKQYTKKSGTAEKDVQDLVRYIAYPLVDSDWWLPFSYSRSPKASTLPKRPNRLRRQRNTKNVLSTPPAPLPRPHTPFGCGNFESSVQWDEVIWGKLLAI